MFTVICKLAFCFSLAGSLAYAGTDPNLIDRTSKKPGVGNSMPDKFAARKKAAIAKDTGGVAPVNTKGGWAEVKEKPAPKKTASSGWGFTPVRDDADPKPVVKKVAKTEPAPKKVEKPVKTVGTGFSGFTPVRADVAEPAKARTPAKADPVKTEPVKTNPGKPAPAQPATVKKKSAQMEVPAKPAGPLPSVLVAQARKAYENGDYDEAIAKYEAVPSSVPLFLRTREELAWTYLRAEKMDRLRGILPHLNSPVVPARWRMEGRVLSSMLYLRDCQYEKTRFEIEAFQVEMQAMARSVDRNLKTSAHRGYWASLGEEMSEAILKMRFVRMELRSRLVMLERQQVIEPQASNKKESVKVAANAQVFPMNGDLWQDEVFRGRGLGNSACQEIHQAKATQ